MNSNRIRQGFLSLSIRTKIILGIVATGGLALVIFAIVAGRQTGLMTATLSNRLETSVSQLAEEQLKNTVNEQAVLSDQTFRDVQDEVESLAGTWTALQNQKATLSKGSYWDASTKLIHMEDGRYGNSSEDPSSIYIPASVNLDDNLLADINTSAYLDFSAPGVLESHPAVRAIFMVDKRGVTRYYPNIDLAAILPPGFDATKRPYFEITSPTFNPQHRTRASIPYMDAAGGGLVMTITSPFYVGDEFNGIVAADMQLTEITQQVQGIKIGETGYAFLLDDAGRIISMPSEGYELFGLDPNSLINEDIEKQTVLNMGPDQLQSVVRRMVAGGRGLVVIDSNGIPTYVSYAPVPAVGYSLALVVPVSELQAPILAARKETQAQIQSGLSVLAVILAGLLALAVTVSLTIGNLIAAPVARLTSISHRIIDGDLSAQADVESRDEIGTLSQAFNLMTSRNRQLLEELENRVKERTQELMLANEINERRAKQFEYISQVAATISSTRDLETLLTQITTAISTKFGTLSSTTRTCASPGSIRRSCASVIDGSQYIA